MKRRYISGVMILALLAFGGCGEQQSYIGADQAKQLALRTCDKTADEADSVTADLVSHEAKDYYLIDIVADGLRYQVEIDALAGTVAEVNIYDAAEDQKESAAAASQAVPSRTDPPDQSQSVSDQTSQTAGSEHHSESHPGEDHGAGQAVSDPAAGSGTGTITLEDAKAKALAHAGLTADQVTFVEGKLDHENGRQVYELEFYTADFKEYDYEIDASSGEVVGYDHDAEHYMPSQSAGGTITAEDAKALALAKVPGASESDIREFETDRDDGRIEYEGKIIYNGTEYEFEIDSTGQIVSWEEEPVRGR
ncbi:MAG: PepSY domain-containing protein [Eubacterium sp.]|nr:PepSY domain-containing protein [Eubacterium sp.]MCM1214637.1 PepSY domain-containing protein [Lachnospiraceae bacterium]MCM1302964.1 PepSY domain-containing protein [Butyrivibrio sp.]MCM1343036.1 PepSY domain-containing protein [Muribaculaceae bacterium]MCM1215617.1 PepSY domain-containing protein [Lachnospiraceae bacterium]